MTYTVWYVYGSEMMYIEAVTTCVDTAREVAGHFNATCSDVEKYIIVMD